MRNEHLNSALANHEKERFNGSEDAAAPTYNELEEENKKLKAALQQAERNCMLANRQALQASIVSSQVQLQAINAEIAKWQQPDFTTKP